MIQSVYNLARNSKPLWQAAQDKTQKDYSSLLVLHKSCLGITAKSAIPAETSSFFISRNTMSKTVLSELDGFTPLIDSLAKQYGIVRAGVFGRIWRYCQLRDGVCYASLETISEDLGLDKATVMRHAKELTTDGYLEDLTPDARNKPHVYRDTGKAGISITIGVAQSNTSEETVAQSNALLHSATQTVAESKLKKLFKDTNKNSADKPRKSGENKPRQSNAIFDAIVVACSPDGDESRKEYAKLNGGWIAKIAANGVRAYPPEKIAQWYGPGGWWYSVRCAGMPNAPRPTPESIKKTIVLAAEWDAKQSTSIKQDVTGGFYV